MSNFLSSFLNKISKKVSRKKTNKWNKNYIRPNLLQFEERVVPAVIDLTGNTGFTPIFIGATKDYANDSQAGAADTDIIGDATHASFYVGFDDNNTPSVSSDDTMVFRMRINNPTSSTKFGGVADVGMDIDNNGGLDIFMAVDGRNNGQKIRILKPGTGANNSPSTTSTADLPTGIIANNGVYPFSNTNYAVTVVSSTSDPNWNGVTDLQPDGKSDVFITWRVPVADLTTIFGSSAFGSKTFNQNTSVKYVNFTQTQTGPINGDLNGVPRSYSSSSTFDSLGVFSSPQTPSTPVAPQISSAPSVNFLSTNDQTPTITGSATLGSGEILKVTLDNITYFAGDGFLILNGTSWTLNIPSPLNDGVYDVTAFAFNTTTNLTTSTDSTSGELTISTTIPTGPIDITTPTDSGINDNITNNGNPVITFAGPDGLSVSLTGPNGALLDPSQYSVFYISGNYTVSLLDANLNNPGNQPFGTYGNGVLTLNPANSSDGLYNIRTSDIFGNSSQVGTFVIDTTAPGVSPGIGILDITNGTDTGANDDITSHGNPILEFTGEAGMTISLAGPNGALLDTTQYSVVYANGKYTVTLVDANIGANNNQQFGTYDNGILTNNPANALDGLYTISVTDIAGNQSTVGTFVIDTTPPGTQPNLFGPLDITAGTDSGADDTYTNNGNPVIEFTGEAGLIISLLGADGATQLSQGTQYAVSYANGKYTVTMLDADPATSGIQPFGTYFNGNATGNGNSTKDGTYTIKATDVAGNSADVGQFVIDTTKPDQSPAQALGPIDITPGTDTGANDTTTADGNPVIEFTGEAGLDISLLGPDGTTLQDGVHYTVSFASGNYSVKLLDADPTNPGYQPFGTYDANGNPTNNGNSTKDGTYTIRVTDIAGNQSPVGTFIIATTSNPSTPPSFGPLDIISQTDTGVDDTTTSNGLPVITFTGPSGLNNITLQGADGTTLAPSQYSVSPSTVNNVTTYTVTLLDADTVTTSAQPFGTYNTTSPYSATGNPTNTGDGLYTILSGVTPVGTFLIDTTRPGIAPSPFGPLDITDATDSGADDNRTNNPNPVLTFTGEAGLTIQLFGPGDNLLNNSQYTVLPTPNGDGSYTYTVTLLDGNTGVIGNGPFGTFNNGSPTNNPAESADGTYIIRALDLAGNRGDVGQFIIDTTAPGQSPAQALGPIDITPGTDTGANDTTTSDGNPVLTFAGEAGLTISLLGPDGSQLLPGTQYTVSYSNGTYTVTLLDAIPGGDVDSFGTYLPDGTTTGNGLSTRDGTYTIKATDVAGNQSTAGSFVIDTTPPGTQPTPLGALDITPTTDSGADDTTTSNGNPVIQFTGEPGLAISLFGPDGSSLALGTQYTVSYANGTYTVTLLDAIPGGSTNPFGDYTSNGISTGNPASVGDGIYTIKAADVAGNQNTVGTFIIDTTFPATSPGLSSLNITTPTDSGADDSVTNNGNPILEFFGEPGLQVSLLGPDGTPLTQGTQYTVTYLNGKYAVTLTDAIPGNPANPFGTNSNGTPTGNPASVADGLYTIKVSDTAGNQSTVGTFTIDTTAPSVVVTSSMPNLASNQAATITFTFNEVPVGFIAGDIVATGGAISNFVATADPKVYTATFTRAASGNTNCSVTVPVASYTDTAANPGTAGSTTISIDTQGPSLVISSDKPNLEYRQTAIITFTFSETPTGFDSGDVNLAGGTLSNLLVDPNNPTVYTALFTPTIDFIGNGLISVANGTFTDSFGNLGTGASINPAISIFNRIRGFSTTGDNSSNVGQNIGNANTGSGTSVVLYNPITGSSNGNVVPFPGFMGEVRVSRADTNGDGILDMIVSPGVGGGPVVKVIDSATGRTLNQFMAYDAEFTGGMFVAVADINRDGFSEIITGAGGGGGPHVKVFDGRTHAESSSFFAYTPAFTGGVSVAAFDFDNDGVLDIVTGAGPGGGPHVKVFNGATLGLVKEFMAYTLNFTGGVYVAAGDFLSDGRYDIITGAGAGGGPHVKIWDYETLNLVAEKMAYDNYTYSSGLVVDILFSGGARVGLADGNDDGIIDVIVGAGPGGGPHVKVLAGRSLDVIRNFFSGEITDSRGVFVGQ